MNDQTPAQGTTRLAPSPTGALHLGNARTFVINWIMARQRGWRIILRIEDLDGPRIKPEAEQEAIEILEWLGLDWDVGPIRQSDDLEPYKEAMCRLAAAGRVFPCDLSRREIERAASAPHPDEPGSEMPYPSHLRPNDPPGAFADQHTNWRFIVEDRPVVFVDQFAGRQVRQPARSIGDFVVWTKRAQPAYQLAVVVDDHRQGVTHIVRGNDLLDSAARQVLLYEALEQSPMPSYGHLPLIVGPDGRRLAKRHGDTRVVTYREAGVGAERLLGLIGWWSGVGTAAPGPMTLAELVEEFDAATMPLEKTVFRPEDDAWLRESTQRSG